MEIKLNKYDAYKDSGVEWLGEIPESWEVRRIKYLFKEINQRSDDGNEELLSVSHYTGVTKRSDRFDDGDLLTNAITLEGYKKVTIGDLVINIMLAWNGSLGFSSFDGITSPAYSIYRLRGNNSRNFFHYLFRTDLYKSEFKRNSSGVIESRLRLYSDDFFRISSILPPLKEQTAIAKFLDDKTAKIDQAIFIKQKQIDLLKERKQILIHKAVTQGINPNVKLKDSGVEWIGEIPEHWTISRLKFLTTFINDGTHGSYPRVDNGYRLLSVRNLIDDKFQFRDDDSQVSKNHFLEISSKFKIESGDVLLAIVGATLGKAAIVEEMPESFVTQRSVCTIRTNDLKYSNFFLFYFIKSPSFQSYLWLNASFSAQPGVYLDTINECQVPLPSIKEQNLISDELNNINLKFEESISLKEKEIDKLKEYKASLINSVVTGKVRVE